MEPRSAAGTARLQRPAAILDPMPPLNPPRVVEAGRPELPAYVSNGLIGLRVLDIPLGQASPQP